MSDVYRYIGRTGDGRGERWSDASASRKRNATFSREARVRSQPPADRAKRAQDAAAWRFDVSHRKDCPDRRKRASTEWETLPHRPDPITPAEAAKRQRDVLRAIHEQAPPQLVQRFRVAYLTPGDASSKDRGNLRRWLKRKGIA